MRYCVIGKKALCLLVLCFFLVCGVGIWGINRAAIQVSSSPKSLPIYSVEVAGQEKKVSFGINCAWGNDDIEQILDTLDQYQIKATFFLVGEWCEKFPESVKMISDRGHEIGNHSDTHPDMPSLSREQIVEEIESCSDKIEAITQKRPKLFRAPSGSYNNTVVDTARELGYEVIQWDCDSLDWKGLTPAEMQSRIFGKIQFGSILLFHNDTDYTAQALPDIIKQVQAEGYQIVPVGELIYWEDYTIDHTGRQFANNAAQSET